MTMTAAQRWAHEYGGSIDYTALLLAFEAGQRQPTEPARVLPNREDVARSWHEAGIGEGSWDRCTDHVRERALRRADAVLALLADQPTVAEVKAEAWHEGLHAGYVYISRCEDAEAAGQGFIVPDPVNPYRLAPTQPTPGVFEAMGLETPEVPNVGGEGR